MYKLSNRVVIHIFQKDLLMPCFVTYGDVKMIILPNSTQVKAYV